MTKKHSGDLDTYPGQFLRCRGLRSHTWTFDTDFNVTTNARGRIIEFVRILSCAGCTTRRHDTYDVDQRGAFTWKSRRYEHADGYLVTRGNPIEADAVRDRALMAELARSLDAELLHRLEGMRADVRPARRLRVVGA